MVQVIWLYHLKDRLLSYASVEVIGAANGLSSNKYVGNTGLMVDLL